MLYIKNNKNVNLTKKLVSFCYIYIMMNLNIKII